MPQIKFQHVVSCSSEDKNNPADNLLRPEGTHKWKNATAGEKSISVVLQLEKASQIHSIDIGNEGSAFVEVLVGRSTASSDQDYQVLLVASSFMTPLEARNGTNRCSVRMFGAKQMSAPVASQKWDRVKLVCTQPFNKTSTYGLSFIKFHSPPDPTEKATPKEEPKVLGHFKLKSDENGDVKTGSLFSTHAKTEGAGSMCAAASARAASRVAEESPKPLLTVSKPAPSPSSSGRKQSTPKHNPPPEKREPPKKLESEVKATPSPSQNREKRKHHVSDDDDTEEEEVVKTPLRKQTTSLNSSTSSRGSAKDDRQPLKKIKSEPPAASPAKKFGKLMENVVFVLSGFQNPYRGELRDKALAMGATYKPDWGKSCTHLICAFVNTPKYNQVRGKGRIVSQKWVSGCYKQQQLLPWRQFRMGDAESPDEDSEDEYIPSKATPSKATPKHKAAKADSDEKMYGGDTDSGDDTEDEIRRIREKQEGKKKAAGGGDDGDDLYGADTDEDAPGPSKAGDGNDSGDSGVPELPDFFSDKKFFFYGNLEAAERRQLTRYITAYDGEIEEYMTDKVHYIVTSSKWDKNFDDALADNSDLVFVKPKWIQMCHEKTKLLPHQPYIVVPDS